MIEIFLNSLRRKLLQYAKDILRIFETTYDITTRSRSLARDLLEEFIEGDWI